jgi:hypothetical protein
MDRRTLIAVLAAGALACGCGGGNTPEAGSSRAGGDGSRATAGTALAKPPKRRGEILVRGEASPASHGPFAFDGRYTVRFEQIAPEDPTMDFAGQTAFVALLDRRRQQEGDGTIRLFRDAARTGRTVVSAHGRYFVDVAFGDFPYAIRFTPATQG